MRAIFLTVALTLLASPPAARAEPWVYGDGTCLGTLTWLGQSPEAVAKQYVAVSNKCHPELAERLVSCDLPTPTPSPGGATTTCYIHRTLPFPPFSVITAFLHPSKICARGSPGTVMDPVTFDCVCPSPRVWAGRACVAKKERKAKPGPL
jgi:hypothetical protein